MNLRHEWKHEINFPDLLILRHRLSAVMSPDPHAGGGMYKIRSLYFDTPADTALREKIDGVNMREKFRIRFYNDDTSLIRLEKKSKINGLCLKNSCSVTDDIVRQILSGTFRPAPGEGRELLTELYYKMNTQGLMPKAIVEYTREPFIFPAGNVRVTMDYDLRTTTSPADFLDPHAPTISVPDTPIILEVKWDEYLPDIVKDAVTLTGRRASAYSKYASCRFFG